MSQTIEWTAEITNSKRELIDKIEIAAEVTRDYAGAIVIESLSLNAADGSNVEIDGLLATLITNALYADDRFFERCDQCLPVPLPAYAVHYSGSCLAAE